MQLFNADLTALLKCQIQDNKPSYILVSSNIIHMYITVWNGYRYL